MVHWRASVAAVTGAAILLVAGIPVLDLLQPGRTRVTLGFIFLMVLYVFAGILLGGLAGLWCLRRIDTQRLTGFLSVGGLIGIVGGASLFASSPWQGITLAAGIFGMAGAAGASIYWLLDRTAA